MDFVSLLQYPNLNLGGPLMSRPGGSCVFLFTVLFWSALSFNKDEIFFFNHRLTIDFNLLLCGRQLSL